MKKVLITLLVVNTLFIVRCFAQDGALAASERKTTIDANWTDRTQFSVA